MHNLCALILEHLRLPQLQDDEAMAKHRVDNARGWYAANLAAAPTWQVAEAILYQPGTPAWIISTGNGPIIA